MNRLKGQIQPTAASSSDSPGEPGMLAARYRAIRSLTESLIDGLTEEDCCVQSQPCCSPVKWHLGHTTWFFERFILVNGLGGSFFNERYEYLFNSYYNALGERQPRACRGLLTRPGLGDVLAFRRHVDQALLNALESGQIGDDLIMPLTLGMNHEQQHQDLLLMDVKHLFSCSPLNVAYSETERKTTGDTSLAWHRFEAGVREIGTEFGTDHRVYDNESPRHRVFLEAFELADRLVTNREYLAFVEDGGYERPEFWLDLGWTTVQNLRWKRPAYWCNLDNTWQEFTLHGRQPLALDEPVVHVSMFEADAFARWSGCRLPTEFELEAAQTHGAAAPSGTGSMLGEGRFHPAPAGPSDGTLRQLVGDLWEWTSSSYGPYPGFTTPPGAIGEYNGKFMCNQYVLRGGCFATPRDHLRPTYRNFFEPEARWQFSGIRLARSLHA